MEKKHESLGGKRRLLVRARPPLTAIEGRGRFGRPTVANTVLSLAAVPFIMNQGGQTHAAYGLGRSRGMLVIQLAGNVKHGGLVELAFPSCCERSIRSKSASKPAKESARC